MGLSPPEVKYWRNLGISTRASWFVLSIRLREPEALPDTFMLAWDTDLIGVIESAEVEVESILCIAPHIRGKLRGWYSRQMVEIWEATDPRDDGNQCVLFVDAEGNEYSGLFMEPAVGFIRKRLVGRTKSVRKSVKKPSPRQ